MRRADFAASAEQRPNQVRALPSLQRIAVIGAGHVGATVAYALMLREIVGEIVLIDTNTKLAEGQALDIEHANALSRPARIWAGAYADAAPASIAVITAGATMTSSGETRLSLLDRSARIVRSCTQELMAADFSGIIVVAANPVDIMAQVAQELSGLPAPRVVGSGTLLDSARLRWLLGDKLGLDPRSIFGYVLGEHGDSEFVAFSVAQIGSVPIDEYLTGGARLDKAQIQDDVRRAGYRIFEGKGFTSFGVASAVVRICEAIVWDERSVLPVSARTTGQYGISDVYLSLPCVLSARGIDRIITAPLDEIDLSALRASADILRSSLSDLKQHWASQSAPS